MKLTVRQLRSLVESVIRHDEALDLVKSQAWQLNDTMMQAMRAATRDGRQDLGDELTEIYGQFNQVLERLVNLRRS